MRAAAFLLACCFLPNCSSTNRPQETSSHPDETGNVTDSRFATIREIFEKQGARVERDASATNTVRIYLPLSVAMTISKSQAQNIASETRGRLGERAIVYIKNSSGDTLGKASPWGVE